MEYNFSRYLSAKKSVDNRGLNRLVWQALSARLTGLEGQPGLYVLDMGGGIGTMFERLVEWGVFFAGEYTLVDASAEVLAAAKERLSRWASRQGLAATPYGNRLMLRGPNSAFQIDLIEQDALAFMRLEAGRKRWDLIAANAFLDLVNVPEALAGMRRLLHPGGLLYTTINFDGMTALEPVWDAALEGRVMNAYHASMDQRTDTGGSQTGRRLFNWLNQAGFAILEAGSSDWVVYAQNGRYPYDEGYFLHHILHFFEQSLAAMPEVAPEELASWLEARRSQIDHGELIMLAHQMDFLAEAV
ncbi:MAG: class I SAM-dependent methyltransferase [Anaerolineae bacterium]|nr:class I SAM-dependent methyltransferase [Anaerolineae bacterium]